MLELAKKLNITTPQGWYQVTMRSLIQNGGSEILAKYNDSPTKLLSAIYPEYPYFTHFCNPAIYSWDNSKFSHVHKHLGTGYWDDISNQRLFMEEMAKKLNISDHEEWYKVGQSVLYHHGAGGLLSAKYNNSPSKLLTRVFPEYLQNM